MSYRLSEVCSAESAMARLSAQYHWGVYMCVPCTYGTTEGKKRDMLYDMAMI